MDLVRQISQSGVGLVMVFAAYQHDLGVLCEYLEKSFDGIPIIGCTTAGEFGPLGYGNGDIVAISIHEEDMTFEVGLLESVSQTPPTQAHEFSSRLARRLRHRSTGILRDENFALMFIDGTSALEEIIAQAFQEGLGNARLVGGTAGTDLPLAGARLFFNGKVVSDAAILLVGSSPFPFEIFKVQHFAVGGDPWVVTAAWPDRRIVTELNGLPAAAEYARALDIAPDAIKPDTLILHPMLAVLGHDVFVRSIRHSNPDESLTFYCSIEPGTVLRPARALHMVNSLTTACENIQLRIGPPTLTLGFDCLLRSEEMHQHNQQREISSIMQAMHTVGFCTLGEQFCGMHVNQTLTGIAFGRREMR